LPEVIGEAAIRGPSAPADSTSRNSHTIFLSIVKEPTFVQ
jgi:hypothetical protein